MAQPSQPRFVPMPKAGERIEGLSRSAIYREAAMGHIKLLKYGRSVLIDVESARAFVAALPPMTVTTKA